MTDSPEKREKRRKQELGMGLFILGVLGFFFGRMAYTGERYFNTDLLELLLFGFPVAIYILLRSGLGIDLVEVFKNLTGRGKPPEEEDE
jgi:hypothetical protein